MLPSPDIQLQAISSYLLFFSIYSISFRRIYTLNSRLRMEEPLYSIPKLQTIIKLFHQKYKNTRQLPIKFTSYPLSNVSYFLYVQQMVRICSQARRLQLDSDSIHIINMSITLKLLYKGNCYKFLPNVNTLELLQQEMNKRYPNKVQSLQYFYEGFIIEDLGKVFTAAKKQGKASIKLQARPSGKNEKSYCSGSEQSFIRLMESSENSKIQEPKVQTTSIFESLMPKSFYQCYKCKGKGYYSQHSMSKLCEICSGKGQFDRDHIYMRHLSQIFTEYSKWLSEGKQVKEMLKVQNTQNMLQEIEEIKTIVKPEMKFREINKAFHLNIRDITKIEKIEIGEQFKYEFQVLNIGIQFPKDLYLVDCDTKESRLVKSLKNYEHTTLEVGPFVCNDDTLLEKLYYLCYQVEDKWMRIGYKFGLRVRGIRVVVPLVNVNANEEVMTKIRDLKSISGSYKNEEYLLLKLKEMGVDVLNQEMQDQTLIEIISSID